MPNIYTSLYNAQKTGYFTAKQKGHIFLVFEKWSEYRRSLKSNLITKGGIKLQTTNEDVREFRTFVAIIVIAFLVAIIVSPRTSYASKDPVYQEYSEEEMQEFTGYRYLEGDVQHYDGVLSATVVISQNEKVLSYTTTDGHEHIWESKRIDDAGVEEGEEVPVYLFKTSPEDSPTS